MSHNARYLLPKILHFISICLQILFLLGWLYAGEMKYKGYAKFWGANKVHMGDVQVAYDSGNIEVCEINKFPQ